MKKHVRVLEEARLVTAERVGRTRWSSPACGSLRGAAS
jgi:DNA-binding transcriptional ArsR family regulator